ncbi:MAG: Heparinase family protein, partial [Bacilli bacterium]|nr:Heparinase family protein [Bacilli bacterium]
MEVAFYSSEFFQGLQVKIRTHAYAQKSLEQLQLRVQQLADRPFDIPLTGGGWSHAYNCPDDGAYLQLIDRHHHKCPICSKVWSGSPWDDTAIANEHWNYSMRCKEAAIVYGITHDDRLLSWCKQILLFYAEHYHSYPFHDKKGGTGNTGGKVQCQTLSEASWIIPLAESCYIFRQLGVLTDEELMRLKDNLFLPVVEVIKENPAGKSNWQTYHNAAKIWIGAATEVQPLIEEAIQDPDNGFLFQMENSLGNDGFWYEGAWGYHFYTLTA